MLWREVNRQRLQKNRLLGQTRIFFSHKALFGVMEIPLLSHPKPSIAPITLVPISSGNVAGGFASGQLIRSGFILRDSRVSSLIPLMLTKLFLHFY